MLHYRCILYYIYRPMLSLSIITVHIRTITVLMFIDPVYACELIQIS